MNDIPRYTLRISRELLDKIGYIAEYGEILEKLDK